MTVSLDERYDLENGRIFVSGVQALVRLAIDQRRRDARAGLNTAGFISGYRGSPLGGVDSALWSAARWLDALGIRFEPGLNEELAATAVAGSQQTGMIGRALRDGVFGIWYAKNPGVDRAADALKHANAAGTAAFGGVLAVSGDDPGAASSTLPNQCDQAFVAALMPVLEPAGLSEVISLGLAGFALSRYSGLWVGFKTVADVIEASATIDVDPDQPSIALPERVAPPPDLNIRWPDNRWDQDERLIRWRLPAAQAFVRANRLDRLVLGRPAARLGIVAAGKAYLDLRQALDRLGVNEARANELGIGVYKVAMPWPLSPEGIAEFARGCRELLVVEERRAVMEPQIKEIAYHWSESERPRVLGKTDAAGAELLPTLGELSPALVARAIAARFPDSALAKRFQEEFDVTPHAARVPGIAATVPPPRVPHFCAGCPHARSTRVPDGSVAMAGIGCHSLRLWMPASATTHLGQMGGEGANWIGLAPFVDARHVFQNIGDGTYTHSGTLAIRAAVAARSNITFRVLFNEATAMTGGQPIEGAPTVPRIAQQLLAEGVRRVAVVSDRPGKYAGRGLPREVAVRDRDQLEALQRELRDCEGVTAIVYDQMCATELRRARKRGTLPVAPLRAFINERVCEGCGDCVEVSQCAALMPVKTAFGPKRRIDQAACNVDLSCVEGFCPSFVTLEGAALRRPAALGLPELPAPSTPATERPWNILIAGIGGTGVMTAGAILGMAAHLEGKRASVLDNTGIARKGGAVSTHVRLAARSGELHCARIEDACADLVIAGDMLGAGAAPSIAKLARGRTRLVIDAEAVPTLSQRIDPDGALDVRALRAILVAAAGEERCEWVEAAASARHLAGDPVLANMVLLGYSFQRGLIPLEAESIDRAIGLNGVEVATNRLAFALGRRAALDPAAAAQALRPYADEAPENDLRQMIERRASFLTAYQDAQYARRYRDLVERVRSAEAQVAPGDALACAVAQAYFRLLAIKDEYEVARLYTDGEFLAALERQFSGAVRMRYHFAAPLLAWIDRRGGRARKRAYGPWMGTVLRGLASLRRLRGTAFDPFRWSAERRIERQLIAKYEDAIELLLPRLCAGNLELAIRIAELPTSIRGFGHVKTRNAERARRSAAALIEEFSTSAPR